MARIDWAVLCDLAYFDRQDRLCLVGIIRTLPAPVLPATLHQAMLVARIADIQPVDEVALAVGMVTPSGQHHARNGSASVTVEMIQEYAIATLRGIPLAEEGTHRFQLQLRGQPVVSLSVPVVSTVATTMIQLQ